MSGSKGNVKVIYQQGKLNYDSINRKENEKLIAWNDFCGYPTKEGGVTLLKELFATLQDALIYQTHSVKIRNLYMSKTEQKMRLHRGSPQYNAYAFGEYFNDGRRKRIPRDEVYFNLYMGGQPKDGRKANTPMVTIGWRTGTDNASHIKKVYEDYND
jgi:hypothetical protein